MQSAHAIQAIDGLVSGYVCGRVVFDNYEKQVSIKKNMLRYHECKNNSILIEDQTPIRDTNGILSNNKTKYRLTLYLSGKLIEHCKCNIVTVTRHAVLTNNSPHVTTEVSSQEEADIDALKIVREGNDLDFYTQYIDFFF